MASSIAAARPFRWLAALTGAAALAVLPAMAGSAAPITPPTATDTAHQIAALNQKLDKAVETYDSAQLTVTTSETRQKTLQVQERAQRKKVAAAKASVSSFASSAYMAGGLTPMASLLDSGSPQNFLDQMATLNRLSRDQRERLNQLIGAEQTLAGQQQQLAAALTTQRTAERTAADTKAQLQRDLATAEQLQASQRAARKAAAQQPKQAAAVHTTARASRSVARAPQPIYSGPATGSAAAAVRFAYAQLGKPYVWGAAGPSSYDCSGLTMASWAAAGVSLPHSSAAQYGSAPHVSLSALRPGDLIFYGSPIHHVALYIGGGHVIHAPVPGEVVQIASMSMEAPVGAVRP